MTSGAAQRVCGSCTLCCTVLDIPELAKPAGHGCVHANAGCAIYPERPSACRIFTCGWLASPALDDAWRPDRAGFLIRDERDEGQLCLDVDPARPGAWRREPYLSQIRAWSRMVHDRSGCLVVYDGGEVSVVFPEQILDLGPLEPSPRLLVGYIRRDGAHWPLVRLLDGETTVREWVGDQPRR
ncbi:MAG: YkgJ family cysteine cluster protein [Caulobacter sp.]|jgi:hypothetical protein